MPSSVSGDMTLSYCMKVNVLLKNDVQPIKILMCAMICEKV